jgi:hypothetical protein
VDRLEGLILDLYDIALLAFGFERVWCGDEGFDTGEFGTKIVERGIWLPFFLYKTIANNEFIPGLYRYMKARAMAGLGLKWLEGKSTGAPTPSSSSISSPQNVALAFTTIFYVQRRKHERWGIR